MLFFSYPGSGSALLLKEAKDVRMPKECSPTVMWSMRWICETVLVSVMRWLPLNYRFGFSFLLINCDDFLFPFGGLAYMAHYCSSKGSPIMVVYNSHKG